MTLKTGNHERVILPAQQRSTAKKRVKGLLRFLRRLNHQFIADAVIVSRRQGSLPMQAGFAKSRQRR
jgi:hypothetical protein